MPFQSEDCPSHTLLHTDMAPLGVKFHTDPKRTRPLEGLRIKQLVTMPQVPHPPSPEQPSAVWLGTRVLPATGLWDPRESQIGRCSPCTTMVTIFSFPGIPEFLCSPFPPLSLSTRTHLLRHFHTSISHCIQLPALHGTFLCLQKQQGPCPQSWKKPSLDPAVPLLSHYPPTAAHFLSLPSTSPEPLTVVAFFFNHMSMSLQGDLHLHPLVQLLTKHHSHSPK